MLASPPLLPAHRAALLFGKTSPELDNQIHLCMPDHRLLSAVNASGSGLLLFALQPGSAATMGDKHPSEHSTALRDNKMTVPAPGAGSHHHHYYNLVRGPVHAHSVLQSTEYFSR